MQLLHDESLGNILSSINKKRKEEHHNLLKAFFEAGGIPDLATDPEDFKTLTGYLNTNGNQSK